MHLFNEFYSLATGAVCFHNGRVVLLRRRDDADVYPSIWELPSGRVEPGETIEKALRREVLEETGLFVKIDACVGYFFYTSKEDQRYIQLNHFCSLNNSNPNDLRVSSEHAEAKWVILKDAFNFDCSENVHNILLCTNRMIMNGIFL